MSLESAPSSNANDPSEASESEQKGAVFLDRDGTLIVDRNYLTNFNDVQLIEDAVESVHRINHAELIPIVITNQSAVGRGMLTIEALEEIHRLIDREFRLNGARIEGFYYCPHHPEASLEEYRTRCDCRKPEPGLILRAAREWNIDLAKSYMVGDSPCDVGAGQAAGCKTILVGEGVEISPQPDFRADCLLDAVNWILEQ